jgi:hypothetical protein
MVNLVTFNGEVLRTLAEQFLALAQARSSTVPLMIGHRVMGHSRLFTGDVPESRDHYDFFFVASGPCHPIVGDGRMAQEPRAQERASEES